MQRPRYGILDGAAPGVAGETGEAGRRRSGRIDRAWPAHPRAWRAITGRRAAALGLFVALVLLAFLFPRLPNRYGGGLWRYFAGYTAVLLLLAEVWRHAESIRGWWAGSAQRRRTAFAMLGIGAARALSAAARRHRSTATRQDSTGGSEPV